MRKKLLISIPFFSIKPATLETKFPSLFASSSLCRWIKISSEKSKSSKTEEEDDEDEYEEDDDEYEDDDEDEDDDVFERIMSLAGLRKDV